MRCVYITNGSNTSTETYPPLPQYVKDELKSNIREDKIDKSLKVIPQYICNTYTSVLGLPIIYVTPPLFTPSHIYVTPPLSTPSHIYVTPPIYPAPYLCNPASSLLPLFSNIVSKPIYVQNNFVRLQIVPI